MDKIFNSLYVNRELHTILFEPVCRKYDLTLTELHMLLFLAEHKHENTAKNIVECLKIAKSYVSSAVHTLEKRGFIEGYHEENDRRSIHLQLCESTYPIVEESREVQKQFLKKACAGFSEKELDDLRMYIHKIIENTEEYLKEIVSNKNK